MIQRQFPATRMRRLRQADWVRRLVGETSLSPSDLIWPVFVIEGENEKEAVASMPGVERLSIDLAVNAAKEAASLGIPVMALFPNTPAKHAAITDTKRSILTIWFAVPPAPSKTPCPILAFCAMSPSTLHGACHDGLMDGETILNDETVEVLVSQSLNQVAAGCDIIAPSDMMDGRIGAIRNELEKTGNQNTLIMAYSAKYASAFTSFPRGRRQWQSVTGDKKTYQMDPANALEAMQEIALDIEEGADMVMVKPGMPYRHCDTVQTRIRPADFRLSSVG